MRADTKVEFPGGQGLILAGRLDRPKGALRGTALFAHCFSCSKDILAAARVSEALITRGIAVLRFDFTGLGHSEGEFANTNFSSNVADLVRAADWLRSQNMAPDILIGHSLGGAAVIVAAEQIPEVKAVATIGAPADVEHVLHQFSGELDKIARDGEAEVTLAGRPFRIQQQFIEDAKGQNIRESAARLKRALLVLHSPLDQTVGIENANALFTAAKHPKSFVSLDNADHLLGRKQDAYYAAEVIGAWASRYALAPVPNPRGVKPNAVVATETRVGLRYQTQIRSPGHPALYADEPEALGGDDTGPSPFQLLEGALGACTAITLRMYAERKEWPLQRVEVEVTHRREKSADGSSHTNPNGMDIFERMIYLEGPLSDEQRLKLHEIAEKCPVHRTLSHGAQVITHLAQKA